MNIILLAEPRKAAEPTGSSQLIQVGNSKGELANKRFQEPFAFKDLRPFADILIGLKRLSTVLKNVFNLCLI